MGILGVTLGIVAGICFGIGLFHLFIGLRRRRADLKHVTFGGFALCYGGSVLGGLLMYQAPSLSRYVVHDRWSGLLVALTFVSLIWFVTVYTASVSRWVPMLLTALFCAVATAHVTRPALVYAEIAGIVPLTRP